MVDDRQPRRQRSLIILVVNADPVGVEVGQSCHNGAIVYILAEGEAHGTLVRVLLAVNAAVTVIATMVD